MQVSNEPILNLARENDTLEHSELGVLIIKVGVRDEEYHPRDIIQANPWRSYYLSLLTSLAVLGGRERYEMAELLKTLTNPHKNYAPPYKAHLLLEEICEKHGHSLSVTIAAISHAARVTALPKAWFRDAIVHDPTFWLLLTNHGRPTMPDCVVEPYTLYEIERIAGGPVPNPSKFFEARFEHNEDRHP
jgi:hypothetical protein